MYLFMWYVYVHITIIYVHICPYMVVVDLFYGIGCHCLCCWGLGPPGKFVAVAFQPLLLLLYLHSFPSASFKSSPGSLLLLLALPTLSIPPLSLLHPLNRTLSKHCVEKKLCPALFSKMVSATLWSKSADMCVYTCIHTHMMLYTHRPVGSEQRKNYII